MVLILLQNSGGIVVLRWVSWNPPWTPTGVEVPWSLQKNKIKMFFRREHSGDISSVYLVNQIFESVSDLFAKGIPKSI